MPKELPGKRISLWLDTTPRTAYSYLQSNVSVDVAVIGGGIAGITTAKMLKDAGARVALIERDRIVRGVTGNTTAKVTALHSLIYKRLIDTFGAERAGLYASANQNAIKTVATFVKNMQIECDFKFTSAYTFSESDNARKLIEDEIKAAQTLGISALFKDELPLPIQTFGSIHLKDQAQFHPRKYLLALAETIPGDGSYIFEKTRAVEVKDAPNPSVTTDKGTVKADYIVVATHFPIFDRSFYYARMKTRRSYVMAVRLRDKAPIGMFISSKDEFHSFRSQPYEGKELFFVGGEHHETGKGGDTAERYRRLAQYAREFFKPNEILYRWSTQDYETEDGVPYVGKLSSTSKRIYVSTGFGGWGMTNATVGAQIITEGINGRTDELSELYDPGRYKPKRSLKPASAYYPDIEEATHVAVPIDTAHSIQAESGNVISVNKERIALYKDAMGKLHAMSAKCTHMGCDVVWNSGERSWDCPCHGSRFDALGKVIQTPALSDLKKRIIEEKKMLSLKKAS